jgi:formate hydrogenlyase subunit 3/multisubunit Na+/H+ antiporter MnhD subunit
MMNAIHAQLATFAFGPQTIAVALATPLVFLLLSFVTRSAPLRRGLLILAPAPALAAAMLAADSGPLIIDQTLFPAVFVLDPPGALLLGVGALLWFAAAISLTREQLGGDGFVACWLLTLLGNIGVFLSGDVVSFYLAFALVSLPAYGLIVDGRGEDTAGGLYLAVALLGEAFLIVAFVALALGAPDRSLLISDGVAALPASPWRDLAVGFLIAGFGAKIGLVPLHVWMPSTYRSTPVPAAAVLAGAAVNAGVIGLIRFFPWGATISGWGEALTALGLFGAFYGVAIGLTQRQPKTILAYSSISQMGLVAATLGQGLMTGKTIAAEGAALYAAHHGLAKGGLFLAIGVVVARGASRLPWSVVVTGLLALSLAGLPPTGGAIAKLAIKETLGDGWIGTLSIASAIASTLLMLHFLRRLLASPTEPAEASFVARVGPWILVTLASVMIPTIYFIETSGDAAALGIDFVWKSIWPVAVGAVLAWLLGGVIERAPRAPEGDMAALLGHTAPLNESTARLAEHIDSLLRRWSVAAAAALAIGVALGLIGFVGR